VQKIKTCFPLMVSLAVTFCICHVRSFAQSCPPNIDFESGTFDGWTCYDGFTSAVGTQNQISLSPSGVINNKHTIIAANSAMIDPYGGFPMNCPNGSGYSIKLGNDQGGGEAEGVSYEFVIPAGQNVYSLIYHYAVVFQDPNHQEYQQPRMVVEITNITDNTLINCSSFTFIPYGNILPGFFESPVFGDDGTPIWCKNWSAVTINLNGLAGKTIRLFFKTADCTFRRHFGYAYIDVNSECSDEFVGATYCPDDTAVNVIAPYGYQGYTWFNNNFTQTLGNQQTLTLTPPPLAGTTIAVQLVPYSGYGCLDTLYAKLVDTLNVFAYAGRDTLSCNGKAVPLGGPPRMGFVYKWDPAIGLTDPDISNPLANPPVTTKYVLTTRSSGGGCLTTDTVVVRSSSIDNSLEVIGKEAFCINSGDSAVLKVQPEDSIQWFRENLAINGAHQATYKVNQSGNYYALLMSQEGCRINTEIKKIFIDIPRPGITYPIEYAVINLPLRLQARTFGNSVLWTPETNLDNQASFTPVFKGNTDQFYTIHITTNSGCVTVDTQVVKIIKGVDIFVPTAFTPNGDGLNDILRPTLMGVKELHFFRVYNRWGQLIYQTSTNRAGWDGKVSGQPQGTGVFVWVVEGMGVDGKSHTVKGTSALIR
jgi:gliding motility-associated-like protein